MTSDITPPQEKARKRTHLFARKRTHLFELI
jgi:hypothetical protein